VSPGDVAPRPTGLSPTLHSSERQDWQTPDNVLDVIRQVDDIALDPCTVESNPTGADAFLTPEQDGLESNWTLAAGLVYCNPPYGREVVQWADKAIVEGESGCPLILLTAARPGSRWCQRVMASADVLCFWRGRIKFRGAEHSAPFDSMFAAWNCRRRFVDAFAPHGLIVGRVA
jgi:phage N-6-adenine-methyltransferase